MTKVRVAGLDELPPDSMLGAEAGGRDVLVARVGPEGYYAVDNLCSHADAWLDMGMLQAPSCEIECPLHGGRFDLQSGKPTHLPCTDPIGSYPVAVVGDDVYVEVPD
jgi:nitrite reductase/ring-hydroxylating ferredoxin subunit